MKDIEFNLIDEPWIRVVTQDNDMKEVNLSEVLLNANMYKGLSGEIAAQNISTLRFLIALMHTIITRIDIKGNFEQVCDEESCIERWNSIWKAGQFPEKPVQQYLKEWKDRFYLFHPDRPFYQVPKASNGTKNGVGKLNGAVSESNNKKRLFSQISGISKERMTYPESARWLLFLNSFDDCAAKQADKSDGSRSFTVGWLGKLGLIYAIGNNLFETIMLNMPMVRGKDQIPWEPDLPTWEPVIAKSRERDTISMPLDLAGLFTLQSRRIILMRDEDGVIGYSLLGGDAFEDTNALNEPMTLWRLVEDKKTNQSFFRPLLHQRKRFIWRNFSSLAVEKESSVRPGIVSWCDLLQRKHIIPRKQLLTFGIVCVRYDSSQSSSITDSFDDTVLFHADILSDAGRHWRGEIEEQVNKIEKVSSYLELLVKDLRRSDGLSTKEDDAPANAAKELFFNEVDSYFRDWLMQLDTDQDNEERNELIIKLQRDIRNCAWNIGMTLIEEAGDSAFIGRYIEIKKNVMKHYSSPEAYQWFKRNIWRLYPDLKGGDENIEG